MPSFETTLPPRLSAGDTVVAVATGFPGSKVPPEVLSIAELRLSEMGLGTTYSPNAFGNDGKAPTIEERASDIHNAFTNSSYDGILSIIGGYDTNSILPELDYEMIQQNPKTICGSSDLTSLLNAIHAKTGLVTYYGPHLSTFGQQIFDEYTRESFESAVMEDKPYILPISASWTDDKWYQDQQNRSDHPNFGPWCIQPGYHESDSIGGNLASLNLLQGTEFFPEKDNPIVFIEEIARNGLGFFVRSLHSLAQSQRIGGLLIGRMQLGSDINQENLSECIASVKLLKDVPVVANLDFGHTLPMSTLPIGGTIRVETDYDQSTITIINH